MTQLQLFSAYVHVAAINIQILIILKGSKFRGSHILQVTLKWLQHFDGFL